MPTLRGARGGARGARPALSNSEEITIIITTIRSILHHPRRPSADVEATSLCDIATGAFPAHSTYTPGTKLKRGIARLGGLRVRNSLLSRGRRFLCRSAQRRSHQKLPVFRLPSRYGLFSHHDAAPILKAIDLVEFIAGEGAVTVWTMPFVVRSLCCRGRFVVCVVPITVCLATVALVIVLLACRRCRRIPHRPSGQQRSARAPDELAR